MANNVLITGVSSGIGHAMAKTYLERGDSVFGLSRRTADDLAGYDAFRFVSVDLGELSNIEPALDKLLKGVDQLDLAILNAGILGEMKDMRETTVDELKHLTNVNLWSNKVILDTLFDRMKKLNQVVAISSGASVNGNRGWSGYSISKAALNMLVKLYAAENPNTHFTAFAPGLVDTAMQDYLCEHEADPRFPSLEKLKSARNTSAMPAPENAAQRFVETFERLLSRASGSYVDVRDMG